MSSLRTLYLVIILLISISILIIVSSFSTNYINSSEVIYVDDLNKSDNSLVVNVYLLNNNNDITYQSISFDDIDNIYYEVFKIYNEKMNSIDVNLTSPLVFYENIGDFQVNNDKLYISLDKVSEFTDINLMLDCLFLTYNQIGINELFLKVGKCELSRNIY